MAPENGVPVLLAETEVLVIGGGFAGVAAALAAASAGRRTCLIERRTYLGAELTATLRPWLTPGQAEGLQALFGREGDQIAPARTGEGLEELPLIPDRLKTGLEDLLRAAGVQLFYGIWPVGLERDDRFTLAVAGKFGQGSIVAGQIIDATGQADLARRFGRAEERSGGGPVTAWRTLEMTGVALELLDAAPLPEGCRAHRGHAVEHGHLLVVHPLAVQPGEGAAWLQAAEGEARFATMALARRLMAEHPAFAGARVTETAHALTLPPLWRVSATSSGLWVAGASQAELDDATASAVAHDPLALARLGREVGTAAAQAAIASPRGAAAAAVPPLPVERRKVDVLVVGGGSSGAACAIGAARNGSRTLLVEMNFALGGTGTIGGVDSYWFGRLGGFNAEISRWVAEQHAWMNWKSGKWNVEAKMIALLGAARDAGVALLTETVLVAVQRDEAGRVTGALVATPDGLVEVEAKVMVDCTGDGDAAVLAGAGYLYGSEREGATMWYSMAPHLFPGMTKNNFTSPVDVGDPADYTRAVLSARRRLPGHDHGPYIAPRESRHITGGLQITLTDILTMRRWPDVVNIHFSNHDVKGHNTSDWIRMGLIPPNLEIEFPYRALVPEGVDGLLVAGKAFSATHDALPPLRMQADLENLGFVCGVAAALCAGRNLTPRALPVSLLQAVLVGAGILPAGILTRRLPAEGPMSEAAMRRWIAALDDSEKLFFYGEVEMDEVRREPIPMVMVCTAGPAIIPLLREELARPDSPRRLHVARALAWYGDRAATPVLLAEIERRLAEAGETVPARTDHIRYSQASPDHGAMPELCYLLHSLAMARDERAIPVLAAVAERLNPTYERFLIHQSGLFHYVDAVCDIAERLGRPECVPALKRIHRYELFRERQSSEMVEPDFYLERLAFLEVVLGRAMARCGEREGLRILISYLPDSRKALVRHAHRELMAISGLELPPEPALWRAWAEGLENPPLRPWRPRPGTDV